MGKNILIWKEYMWEKSTSVGKLLILFFIPEITYTIYLLKTDISHIENIGLVYFIHGVLLFRLNGKAFQSYYIKMYGKEKGYKLYNQASSVLTLHPINIKYSLFNPKFLLFVLFTNPLEIMGGFYISYYLFMGNSNNFLILFIAIIFGVAIQDLIFFDYLRKRG